MANKYADLTSDQLIVERLKLALELYSVDSELFNRRYEDYRKNKPRLAITEADLAEEKQRKGVRRKITVKTQKAGLSDVVSVLESLTSEERQRIKDAMGKIK